MSASPGASPSTLASIRNPFLHQVVSDPWDRAEADVPQINSKVFDMCRQLIEEVAETERATSLLLHGVAGSGKTHVMARLREYLQSKASRVVFISVRMDSAPSRIWRHFRRHLVDDLLRPWEGPLTRLQLILRERPATEDLRLNYNLKLVLARYNEGKLRSECGAWLRGEHLPENVLANLGVVADSPEEESLEEQAHEVVVHLCRLAAPDPVVFCCDEMEILETYPGDQRGLFAYAKLASTLVQEATNVMVISSVQSAFLETLQQSVHKSLFQKTSLNRIDLQPLTWAQGKYLLLTRMAAVPELAALRTHSPADALWPLSEKDLKAEFEPGDACVARKLIHRAKDLFEAARGLPIPKPLSLPETLAARLAEHWDRGASLPTSADDILLQGLPMLLDVTGKRIPYNQEQLPKTVDLLADSGAGPIAISVCNQENLGWLARRFKKILEEADANRFPRLVLLRDSRSPIGKNAVKCHERLKSLQDRGARLVQPDSEVLAALNAMRNLLADAAAGNLIHGSDTIPPSTVREWLAANVPNVLRDFLDDLSGAASSSRFAQELLDYVNERFVVSVKDAAQSIQVPDEEIAAYALRNPGQVGYLAGPPGVLFRLVPEAVGGESGWA
jgi:hypothetical protein